MINGYLLGKVLILRGKDSDYSYSLQIFGGEFSKKRNIWLLWDYMRSDSGQTWPQQDIGTEGKAAIFLLQRERRVATERCHDEDRGKQDKDKNKDKVVKRVE